MTLMREREQNEHTKGLSQCLSCPAASSKQDQAMPLGNPTKLNQQENHLLSINVTF